VRDATSKVSVDSPRTGVSKSIPRAVRRRCSGQFRIFMQSIIEKTFSAFRCKRLALAGRAALCGDKSDVLLLLAARNSHEMAPRAFSPPYPYLTKSPPMTKSNCIFKSSGQMSPSAFVFLRQSRSDFERSLLLPLPFSLRFPVLASE